MGKQAEIFLDGEGKAWIERNKRADHSNDPVLAIIERNKLKPISALEVGCGTGWRLRELENLYGTKVNGLDPGLDGSWRGDARNMSQYTTAGYALVVFGFCLYLVDREDLFRIVYEADRLLLSGGHLIIHDFVDGTYARPYRHKSGVMSYHHTYMDLWLANPQYETSDALYSDDGVTAAFLLRKQPVHEAYEPRSCEPRS